MIVVVIHRIGSTAFRWLITYFPIEYFAVMLTAIPSIIIIKIF